MSELSSINKKNWLNLLAISAIMSNKLRIYIHKLRLCFFYGVSLFFNQSHPILIMNKVDFLVIGVVAKKYIRLRMYYE